MFDKKKIVNFTKKKACIKAASMQQKIHNVLMQTIYDKVINYDVLSTTLN